MSAKYDVNTVAASIQDNTTHKSTENCEIILNDKPEAGTFRTALPQFLACMAKNLLLFDLGMAVSFPTIAIPVLRGLQKDRNPDEFLFLTPEQTSWYASIAFLVQPIGSILSGWLTEPIGRKKAMIFVNIPLIIGWYMLYQAGTVIEIYLAGLFLGLGVGFMEASTITYVGEISHPSIRGILLAFASMSAMFGIFTIYTLGSITTWRIAALYCVLCPIVTIIAILFLPETPYWLLSKKRDQDALEALQWLRGWVSSDAVKNEFNEMKRYVKESNICQVCDKLRKNDCIHKSSFVEKSRELLRKKTIRPFFLIFLCFAVVQVNGLSVLRPYMVQVFQLFQLPIDSNKASIIIGSMDIASNLFCLFAIKSQGKRKLFLIATLCCSLCCISLSINAFYILPIGTNSFDMSTLIVNNNTIISAQLPISLNNNHNNYFALSLFIILAFSAGVCTAVPWMMISEIFPFKVRGTTSGLAAASNYLLMFIVTKTYLDIDRGLSLAGALLFYGIICAAGLVLHFFILPETEGKTLEEIENYFSDKTRKLTDLKIQSNPTRIRNGGYNNEAFN